MDSAKEAIKDGVYDYVTKPFEPLELIAEVERALEKQLKGRLLKQDAHSFKKFQKSTMDRELKMVDLKRENKELRKKS